MVVFIQLPLTLTCPKSPLATWALGTQNSLSADGTEQCSVQLVFKHWQVWGKKKNRPFLISHLWGLIWWPCHKKGSKARGQDGCSALSVQKPRGFGTPLREGRPGFESVPQCMLKYFISYGRSSRTASRRKDDGSLLFWNTLQPGG